MKTILITGGAGFLGSNLCEKLLKQDNKIICVDNLYTGKEKNIEYLLSNPNFKFIKHDIINPLEIEEHIDEIYNLACPASPPFYQADPIGTTKTCVFGIINMLELAKKNNAKILQASTSEVYGEPEMHPQVETYRGNVNPIGIRSCYDEGKRAAESLMFDYHRLYNINIKVIRIFNTYGPKMNQDDGRVVSNFIVQALRGEDITVYGDGTQTRSFCYVDDLLEGMVRLMNSNITGPVNIGNPGEFTMLELANKVIQFTNSTSKIVYRPIPSDDPTRRRPNISLAKEKLNWEPLINLDCGLKQTIEYFKDNI